MSFRIRFEGWADPTTGKPYQLTPVAGLPNPSGVGVDVPALIKYPRAFASQIQFEKALLSQSTKQWVVGKFDLEPGAQDLLQNYVYPSRPAPVAVLSEDLDALDTVATLSRLRDQPELVPGDRIYTSREVMRVENITGGPTIYTALLTRGLGGSEIVSHGSGIDADREVYTQNPVFVSRAVTVLALDRDGNEAVVWRGMLEPPPGMANRLTELEMSARDDFARLYEHELGAGRLEFSGGFVPASDQETFVASNGVVVVPAAGFTASPIASHYAGGQPGSPVSRVALFEGDTLVAANVARSGDAVEVQPTELRPAGAGFGSDGYTPIWGPIPSSGDSESTVVEVLTADADSDHAMIRNEVGERSDHPFDILLAIWTSTGRGSYPIGGTHTVGPNGPHDWLPAHWGCAVPVDSIDLDSIYALRDGPIFGGLRARSFVLGADDKLPTVAKAVRQLLEPLFVFPALTDTGKLSLTSLADPGPEGVVATITDANLAEPIRRQKWSSWRTYKGVQYRLGRVDAGRKKYVRGLAEFDIAATAQRSRYPNGVRVLEIDARDYGETGKPPSVDSETMTRFRGFAEWRLTLLRDRIPPYQLKLKGVGLIGVGQWVQLSAIPLVSPSGRRGVTNARCFVYRSSLDVQTGIQEIEVLDASVIGGANKLVTPSWVIESVTSPTEFTIIPDLITPDDTATWRDGYPYELYNRRGVPRSTDGVSTGSIVGNTVTLDAPWESGGSVVTPQPGDVIELPRYSLRGAWGDDWAYIGNVDATLGADGDTNLARWSMP